MRCCHLRGSQSTNQFETCGRCLRDTVSIAGVAPTVAYQWTTNAFRWSPKIRLQIQQALEMRDTDCMSKKMPHRTTLDNASLPHFTVVDWHEHGVEAARSSQDN